jgi:hypothetical protein
LAAIHSLLSPSSGLGFKAQGADPGQLKSAYDQTQASIKQQQDFVNSLGQQGGLAHQNDVFGQQQALANQYQNIAAGQGPNPAQAQLAQATGANVANQAAMMAAQRGAGANPALMARQSAMQGAGIQQQSAGQAATLQAQQSLGALSQLQNQQANMANMANQQVGQQQTGLQNLGQQSLGQQSNLMGLQASANSANSALAGQAAKGQMGLMGSLAGAAGGALGTMYGGPVGGAVGSSLGTSLGSQMGGSPEMAEGGAVPSGPRSKVGQHFAGMPKPALAEGGKVPALVSPGEQYLDPKDVSKVKQGANPLAVGERIPGTPKVPGNSYANDTVHKTLESGGIVIPNKIMQSKDAAAQAAKFVEAILKKKGSLPKNPGKK